MNLHGLVLTPCRVIDPDSSLKNKIMEFFMMDLAGYVACMRIKWCFSVNGAHSSPRNFEMDAVKVVTSGLQI